MHTFAGTDGSNPVAALIQGTDGNFYGTTLSGGVNDQGTVFTITSGGKLTTLHSFNGTDGALPLGSLVQTGNGAFYGTTETGGANNSGTVFKFLLGTGGVTLYSFCANANCADGSYPAAGLIEGTDGNLYGTTTGGGAYGNYGTIFAIKPTGALSTLHNFMLSDGSLPAGGLVQGTNGKFYGTTYASGVNNDGTIFSLDMGFGPFVSFVRSYGKVGHTGPILGQGFTGTTSVSLNGIPASFTVISDTFIKATVPPRATTGYVQVVTPGGTLTSNVPFRVLP
jgi:uncharacterized repeat protein (TIGR03803 family)